VTLTGFIRDVDKRSVTLSLTDQPDPCLKISRADVVIALADDVDDRVTVLVKADAEFQVDLKLKASDFSRFGDTSGCGCGSSSEVGDATGAWPRPDATQAAMAPQVPGLTGRVPWPWCRDACEYCRRYGWYCWPCFICAIIASNSEATRS
jgi:hypothetical protein